MASRENPHFDYLRGIILVVHHPATPDDLEAQRIIEKLLDDVDPTLKGSFEIRQDLEVEDRPKPFMLASPYEIHYGLGEISSFVCRERRERLHDIRVA